MRSRMLVAFTAIVVCLAGVPLRAAPAATEIAAQQWLADISYRLLAGKEAEFWEVGGSQHGNTSIRYQAAFAGYAAAALGMRTPAYPALTERILSNMVAR